MHVTCEKCGVVFKLDEKRVNPLGSKARCSICGSVFTIYPPKDDEENKESAFQSKRKSGFKIYLIVVSVIFIVLIIGLILQQKEIISFSFLHNILLLFRNE
jgi:predicted Zn finger-like uncharacterized protein